MNIRLLIVDDHPVVRHGLETFLKADPEIQVVGLAENGLEAVQKAKELKPHIIIMDFNMPIMDGIEATTVIKQELPEVRVLILTFALEESVISRALSAGADGCFIKGKDTHILHQTIKDLGRRSIISSHL